MADDLLRPSRVLVRIGREDPTAWKRLDELRGRPTWPEWCFVPFGLVERFLPPPKDLRLFPPWHRTAWALAALSAWRLTQGIYRFDPDLLEAVWTTPLDEVPSEALLHLPDWCSYICFDPPRPILGTVTHGFWAHLDFGLAKPDPSGLRLLLDGEREGMDTLTPIGIEFGVTLREATERMARGARAYLADSGQASHPDVLMAPTADEIAPLVSLVLYLCSENAEVSGPTDGPWPRPHPRATRTRKGLRFFPPPRATEWQVGYRIGAELRAAAAGHRETGGSGGRASPRPHFRRAHWHTYWTGPKDPARSGERSATVRWVRPIVVGLGQGDLVATVRPIPAPGTDEERTAASS